MPKGKVAVYARISPAEQKEDLEKQKQKQIEGVFIASKDC